MRLLSNLKSRISNPQPLSKSAREAVLACLETALNLEIYFVARSEPARNSAQAGNGIGQRPTPTPPLAPWPWLDTAQLKVHSHLSPGTMLNHVRAPRGVPTPEEIPHDGAAHALGSFLCARYTRYHRAVNRGLHTTRDLGNIPVLQTQQNRASKWHLLFVIISVTLFHFGSGHEVTY
jgi:hypothetical protein